MCEQRTLPDDPRDLEFGQYIARDGEMYEVIGHTDGGGLPIIRPRDDSDVPEYHTEVCDGSCDDTGRGFEPAAWEGPLLVAAFALAGAYIFSPLGGLMPLSGFFGGIAVGTQVVYNWWGW